MKTYKIYAPTIEVRGTSGEKDPEYVVRGVIKANIPDHYGTLKLPNGQKKALRSVFTENAIKSIERQAKSKKIFVDAEHKTAAALNIRHWLDKANIDPELKENILKQVEMSDFPLGKVVDVIPDESDPSTLIFDTRLNPSFRKVSDNHSKYFDAVWESLQNKFLDRISFDFAPTKVKEIDGISYIDDVVIYGIDYTGGGALPENEIFDVAMRATQEFIQMRGSTMENNEKDELAKIKEQYESEKKKLEQEKLELQKKLDEEKISREKEQYQKEIEKMKSELENIKKQNEGRRSVVPSEDKYNAPATNQNQVLDDLEYAEKIRKMLEERVRLRHAFPNREDIWGMQPRRTNQDGDLSLGHLLDLHKEYFQAIKGKLSTDARSVLATGDADIHIPRRK